MSQVWFTSDLHFNHKKVAELRQEALNLDSFATPDLITQHSLAIVENWNTTVNPDDVVWVLGDIGLGRPSKFLPVVDALNGRKFLITGNHDKVWAAHSDARRHFAEWSEVFDYIAPFAKLKLDGRQVLLSHFPYEGDHTSEDRAKEFRLQDTGKWIIHGHVHSEWKRWGRQINAGLDVWNYAPITSQTIMSLIAETEKKWMNIGHQVESENLYTLTAQEFNEFLKTV